MTKTNKTATKNRRPLRSNEITKRAYREYLCHADGKSESTIRQRESAIIRYEDFTRAADFKTFDQDKARRFKEHLLEAGLSVSTVYDILQAVKKFFLWLSHRPGYKRSISRYDAEYLNLPKEQIKEAKAPRYRPHPTLAQVEEAVRLMPSESILHQRDRALVAALACTGMRIDALVSLSISNYFPHLSVVDQSPRNVRTKFRKAIHTPLLKLSPYLTEVFESWLETLKKDLLFSDHDPIFPKAENRIDNEDGTSEPIITKQFWSRTSQAREIVKCALKSVGAVAYTPHRFRNMLVHEGFDRGFSPLEMKALSQSLGHSSLSMTYENYGTLSDLDVQRVIGKINEREAAHRLEMHSKNL